MCKREWVCGCVCTFNKILAHASYPPPPACSVPATQPSCVRHWPEADPGLGKVLQPLRRARPSVEFSSCEDIGAHGSASCGQGRSSPRAAEPTPDHVSGTPGSCWPVTVSAHNRRAWCVLPVTVSFLGQDCRFRGAYIRVRFRAEKTCKLPNPRVPGRLIA